MHLPRPFHHPPTRLPCSARPLLARTTASPARFVVSKGDFSVQKLRESVRGGADQDVDEAWGGEEGEGGGEKEGEEEEMDMEEGDELY